MFISIRNKILISQFVLTFVTVSVLGYFSYKFMEKYIIINDKKLMGVLSERIVHSLNDIVDGKKIMLRRLVNNEEFVNYRVDFRDSVLLQHFSKFTEEFPVLGYLDENGLERVKIINGRLSEELSDHGSDENFLAALKDKNQIIISDIADSSELKAQVIKFYIASYGYSGNEFQGVIFACIPVYMIKDAMDNQEGLFSKLNFALIDGSGRVVFQSKEGHTDKITIKDKKTGKPIISQTLLEKVFLNVNLDGIDSFVYCMPVWVKDWLLFVSSSSKDFLAAPAALGKTTIMLSLTIFICSLILSVLLARYLTIPVTKLLEGVNAISNGKFGQVLNIKTHDEIRMLGDSFNKMSLNLQETMISKDYVTNLIEGMFETLIVFDSESTIKTVNNALCRLLCYEKEELINKKISIIIDEVEVSSKKIGNISFDDIAGKGYFEAVYKSKDGGKISVILSWSVITGTNSGEIDNVFIARDIRERIKAERELKDAYDKLKTIQSQLLQTEKMAAIGQLAGGVAHEINNPLTGVLNNAQLIKMIAAEKGNINIDEFSDLLNTIEESALRCKRITESLLNFSRISAGAFKKLSVNTIIDKGIDSVGQQINLKDTLLKKELQPDIPHIQGDSSLLQQVIIGMVSNAEWAVKNKFNKKPGGVIIIRSEHLLGNGYIDIYIMDNGIGIAGDIVSKIFEPFFTTKEVNEGTGLGLSLVYSIIKEHGGTIDVKSKVNEGTTFKISLPVVL